MKNKKLLIISTSVLLLILFFVGTIFYKNYEAKRLGFLAEDNFSTFVREYSPILGDESAKVYVTEFLDPECESCAAFYPNMKQILSEYQGKIKLVVRYAPFHENSAFAIKILEASRKQGKYWETMELLFKNLSIWGSHHDPRPDLIWDLLPQIGLDIEKIKQDMNDPKIVEIIQQDIKDGNLLGVRGTPTFFVNGKMVVEFGPSYLRDSIESELKNNP